MKPTRTIVTIQDMRSKDQTKATDLKPGMYFTDRLGYLCLKTDSNRCAIRLSDAWGFVLGDDELVTVVPRVKIIIE